MEQHHIALIRHGDYQQKKETPSALQPFPLTATGRQQAQHCVAQLLDFAQKYQLSVDQHIHCSPLLRAWETATIIGETLTELNHSSHEIVETPNLVERNVGAVANLTIAEIEEIIATDPRYRTPPTDWKSNSDYCLPFLGAESLLQAGERVANYIQSLSEQATKSTKPAKLTIVVGHGASIRHAAHHLGILKKSDIKTLSMFHCGPVFISNKQQSGWTHVDGDWKVRSRFKQENID